MKRIISLVLVFSMMFCVAASAEVTTMEQLEAMTKSELVTLAADLLGITPTESAVEVPSEFTIAQKGDKGENVQKIQARLIELGYLTGSADGSYGNGTAGAVSTFQSQNQMEASGVADVAMQELLFSSDCPKAIVYGTLDYVGVSRNASDYVGQNVKFDGRILQVIEDDDLVAFRIATKGNYDNVVFVEMSKPEHYSRLLEDDKVTVYGMYFDLYSYQTVRGDTITIPLVLATNIVLK